jgi:hypothetical protein
MKDAKTSISLYVIISRWCQQFSGVKVHSIFSVEIQRCQRFLSGKIPNGKKFTEQIAQINYTENCANLHCTATHSTFMLHLDILTNHSEKLGKQVTKLGRWVAKLGIWVAKLGRWVAKLGRWVAREMGG